MHVKTLCLAILSMGDASGYEIKKLLEGPFSHIHEASFGAIYPALARLQEEGLVTCEERSQEKRPDKKVYALTQQGRYELIQELEIVPGADRIRSDFLVLMLYAHLLSPAHIEKVLDRRLEIYRGVLGELNNVHNAAVPAGEESCAEFVRGYGKALLNAGLEYIEENRHLVEGASFLGGSTRKPSTTDDKEERPVGAAAE